MKFQKPKGTADILPVNSAKWNYVEKCARKIFNRYCFKEIRTPIFENFDIFARSAGDTSDVVTKEMYDFYDKGDRHIALRPEGTAGVVRAYIENKLYAPEEDKPYKVFYMGPMFRYERPQAGRMREFHQIGVEAFDEDSPELDVEVMMMSVNLFKSLGLNDLHLVINTLGDKTTRDNYRQALIDYLEPHKTELSDDSQERLYKNPLRVLDSKDLQDQKIVSEAPSILDFLTDDAKARWERVLQLLDLSQINYSVDANMVRGLDYYNHTIFEIESHDESLSNGATICGGGRYDGLVAELGGPETSGFGFGIGEERLLLLLDKLHLLDDLANNLDIYVVNLGNDQVKSETFKLVNYLRNLNYAVDFDYRQRKMKAQFKSAEQKQAKCVLILGEKELNRHQIKLKNLIDQTETMLNLSDVYTKFKDIFNKYVG